MKISWFIPPVIKLPWQKRYNYDKVMASVWIRCFQLIPYLRELGIESEINTWNRSTRVAVFLRQWDTGMQQLALKLKKKGVKIIVDTPVNYFSCQDLAPFKGKAKQEFDCFVRLADAVFCPSAYIARFGEKKGFQMFYLPDSINFKHFSMKKEPIVLKTKPVLIWSGVEVKSCALNFLAPAIRKNAWEVVIISERPPALDFKYSYVKWSYKAFPDALLKGSIGIFPRRIEDEYDKGHSFFKIGVFLAQHIPVICSKVSSYNDILTDSNSICPNTLEVKEWENSIRSLISGEKKICFDDNPVEQYSTFEVAKKYQQIFNQMVA